MTFLWPFFYENHLNLVMHILSSLSSQNDVHAFLFTDMFVLAKVRRGSDKFRITKQPYRLNKVDIRILKDPGSFLFLYLNEYGMLASAFTLQVNPGELVKWISALEKAKVSKSLWFPKFRFQS